MRSLALAAIGRDRPGIVARVSGALFDLGCNVEDSSMTLLRGNFAMMLVFAGPDELTAEDASAALRPACEEMGLTFNVLDVGDTSTLSGPTHVVTVYGADRPGILHRTSAALAAAGANITDLSSRLIAGDVYALMLEIEAGEPAKVDEELRAVAADLAVEIVLNEREADVL